MPEIAIEQALYGNPETGGFRFLGRSPGFRDEWLGPAERLCAGFGNRPAEVACPGCVFAQPFGPEHVAVVQAADLGSDDAQRPGALGFRLLIVGTVEYEALSGDLFLLADKFPPPWQQRGDLPALSWQNVPPPQRTVAQIQQVLRNGDSATLLGGVQALIDSGKLVFERPKPDGDLLRKIWLLLPTSTRCHLWPASFAFSNALGFDVLVVPRADVEQYANYVREEQAGDYPEGRYELNLQIAVEAGDQAQLDALFARRSSTQTLKLALLLLVVVAVIALVSNIINPPVSKRPAPATSATLPVSGQRTDDLPTLDQVYPPLDAATSQRTVAAIQKLLVSLEAEPEQGKNNLEGLLDTLQQRLSQPDLHPDAQRLAGFNKLREQGKLTQPEARLRALLWLYGVPEYGDNRRNPTELVELLEKKLGR